MRKLLSFCCFLILLRCQNSAKTLDFGDFTIQVPANWTPIKTNGIDSYTGKIAIDGKDTVSFDLGWYSNDLSEDVPYRVENGQVYLLNWKKSKPDTAFYDYYGMLDTVDLKKILKNEVIYDTIDGKKAKIVYPKHAEHGLTGVYFDSLWSKGSGVDRLQLNGKNLNAENQSALLTSIRTIRFHKRNTKHSP